MGSIVRFLVLLLVVVFYGAVLYVNLNERQRRSLVLHREVADGDRLHAIVKVVAVDMNKSELNVRMSFRPEGSIAADQLTPSVDLKLLVNSIRGDQAVSFRRDERMLPIEVVIPLDGEWNRYPFDQHAGLIAFMVTKPALSSASPSTVVPYESESPMPLAGSRDLVRSEVVPVSVDFSAAIPGFKFKGEIDEGPLKAPVRIQLKLRRADNVIVTSIMIMTMMMVLAFSLLVMVLYATRRGQESTLVPLSVSVSLIFGLPALRNTQPGVPPLGAFGDYIAFLWAEVIVSICVIIVVWTWILRSHQMEAAVLDPRAGHDGEEPPEAGGDSKGAREEVARMTE